MKYIKFEETGFVFFPKCINHDDMRDVVMHVAIEDFENVKSAGFYNAYNSTCSGRSETLHKDSIKGEHKNILAEMRYIVVHTQELGELMFVFPASIEMTKFEEAVCSIRFDEGFRGWDRKLRDCTLVSYGTINMKNHLCEQENARGLVNRNFKDNCLFMDQ